ncbi:MAG: Bax inhibitor-1/YccA family protein [Candidatus Dadabacteria bacterium]|nr:MAG: Bax inhibitor-1/YccA family protein [Candidatus Dadabacteria bacterium]
MQRTGIRHWTPSEMVGEVRISKAEASAFVASVYRWMAAGLALTAVVAWAVASSATMQQLIFGQKIVFYGLIAAEFGLVLWLSLGISRMSPVQAATAFVIYSALNGATISSVLLVYTGTSVAQTFAVAGGMFAAAAAWGHTTKRDLSGMGSFLFMGLIGLVLASVVNIFLGSSGLDWILSVVGVFLFTGLAAWDAQRMRELAASVGSRGEAAAKFAIVGALALYLDFINLFLFLLRFLGQQRD